MLNEARQTGDLLETGFCILASLKGFEISNPVERMPDLCSVDDMMEQFKRGYLVTNSKGESCTLSVEEMNQLENDICDYVEYRLNRWIKKGR